MADEEPPALSGPPPSAFSSGGPPPAAAFQSSGGAAASSDLNSRWKQYESEMAGSKQAHENYDLYETPEKLRRTASTTASKTSGRQLSYNTTTVEPRKTYSFTKSSSYDTNALIAKYAGVSGMGVPSSGSALQRTLSNASASSSLSSSARAEAMQVLAAADEQHSRISSSSSSSNQPFQVSRTESGGFRASAVEDSYGSQKTKRMPSALAGLGMGGSKKPDWKAGRYSFSDPKFKEDDYLAEEEDEIMVGRREDFQDEIEVKRNYSDNHQVFKGVAFDGDHPSPKPSLWSSRYSDTPGVVLDRFDKTHASEQQRSSARNMFMSTANNVGDSVKALGGRLKKTQFSFKERSRSKNLQLPGSPTRPVDATGSTNLRTVWKDQEDYENDGIVVDNKSHKTWEQVMREKKRRRTIGLSILCAFVAAIVIGVTLVQTSWRWKYRNMWGNGNTQLQVTFYATSNSPQGYGANENQFLQDLQNLPSDADFVAHLGNLQDATINMCPASRMSTMKALMDQSPVPVYVVPGDHDWILCPDQMTALARWLEAFGSTSLEEEAASDDDYTSQPAIASLKALEFDRPKTTPEIFSKLQHGVLIIGLHLAHGTVVEGQGMQEQVVRNEKMALFVRGTLERLQGQYRALVLLGNARPANLQQMFFDSIQEDLAKARVPTMYVHGGSSNSALVEHYPFGKKKSKKDGLSGMLAVQAPSGNQKPLKITVGFGKKIFTIGEEEV